MPYTPAPTGRKASDYLALAMEDLTQARRSIYEVFRTTDPVRINQAMADALDRLDGVASYHQEMLLLHTEANKRGPYKKSEATSDERLQYLWQKRRVG